MVEARQTVGQTDVLDIKVRGEGPGQRASRHTFAKTWLPPFIQPGPGPITRAFPAAVGRSATLETAPLSLDLST